MSRNTQYIVIAVLAAALIVVGYLFYRDSQKTEVGIQFDEDGVTIEGN